jgi:BirA family biotin operon repressor/biotin-[acetyl-CoA-carboxylase] ligase
MAPPELPVPIRWEAEALWESVVPLLPGFTVEVLREVDSTNSELMRRVRTGALPPTLLVAERQSAGRGRLGRDWHSDPSGQGATLTFSLGLPLQPADWSGLSLAVGLSVVQSLHPSLQLKWPNDVWWQGRKMAGILIETAAVGEVRHAVIGIGINILPVHTAGLAVPAAALDEVLPGLAAPAVLARLLLPLVHTLQQFEAQGFAVFRSAYQSRDLLYGHPVRCTDGTEGVACGIDASGALLLQTIAGVRSISSAEVSVRPVSAGPAAA